MKKTYIYTLSHPVTKEVRYVGKTINIKRRYKQHLYDKHNNHKSCWVKSLRNKNLKPIINILEECYNHDWKEREIYWISQYNNLTNFSKGGDDSFVRTTSEQTRKKLSEAHKGKKLTKTHKDKIKDKSIKSSIIIDDIEYYSIMDASRKLKIPKSTIFDRVRSDKFPNYFYKI